MKGSRFRIETTSAGKTASSDDPPQVLAATKPGVVFSVTGKNKKSKCFDCFLFLVNVSPKTSLNIPSLRRMLFLILKTTCVVFLETFVNFGRLTGAFTLEGIIMEICTTTSALKVG